MPKKKKAKHTKKLKRAVKKTRRIKKATRKTVKKAKKVKAKKAMKKPVKTKAKKARPAKRAARSRVAAKKALVRKVAEKVIGRVTHYYDRIGVAVIEVKSPIHIGDVIRLKHGEKTFEQRVASMQVNHTPINVANKGQEVGMKVDQVASEGTLLLKA